MTNFITDQICVVDNLSLLVRRVTSGQGTVAEIEQVQHAANVTLVQALLLTEFLRRELDCTLSSEIMNPMCDV